MRDMIANGSLAEAHPATWAPFAVVGEGGASGASLSTQAIAPQPAPLIKDAAAPSKANRLKTPIAPNGDWKGTIWQSR